MKLKLKDYPTSYLEDQPGDTNTVKVLIAVVLQGVTTLFLSVEVVAQVINI